MSLSRTAGICGVASPLIALAMITVSISSAPWFSWTDNCISDLAGLAGETPVWAARGVPSVLFNTGMFLSGALALIAAIGIIKGRHLNDRTGLIGSVLLALAASALFSIGMLPETIGAPHLYASAAFFSLAPLSMFFIGASLVRSGRKIGWLPIALGVVSLCSASILVSYTGCAVKEMVSITSMCVFMVVVAARIFLLNPE